MECASCRADLDATDRYCPACRMPNVLGTRHPRFGPAERDPGPIVAPRPLAPGSRPCPRCHDGVRVFDNYCRSCGLDVSRLAPLPSSSRTFGVWTTPGPQGLDRYRPLQVRTLVLQLIVAAVAIVAVGLAGVSLIQWRNLDGGSLPMLTLPRADVGWSLLQSWVTRLAVVQVSLVIVASMLTVSWTARAYRNLSGLEVHPSRLRPIWASLGWLVPGVNLVMPKVIMDRTWRESAPDPEFGGARPASPIPTINHLWWVCSLVALPTVALAMVAMTDLGPVAPVNRPDVHAATAAFILLAVAELLLVFASVLFIVTLQGVARRQRLRALQLGPAPALMSSRRQHDVVPQPPEEVAEVAATVLVRPVGEAPPRPALAHLVGGDALAGRY
jgi:hypothetical protein